MVRRAGSPPRSIRNSKAACTFPETRLAGVPGWIPKARFRSSLGSAVTGITLTTRVYPLFASPSFFHGPGGKPHSNGPSTASLPSNSIRSNTFTPGAVAALRGL